MGDESSEDEAQMKWEEQQIKKAVKLSQVTHAFLTIGRCFSAYWQESLFRSTVISPTCLLVREVFRKLHPNSLEKMQ